MQTLEQQKKVFSKTNIENVYQKLRLQHRLRKQKVWKLTGLLYGYCEVISSQKAKMLLASVALMLSLGTDLIQQNETYIQIFDLQGKSLYEESKFLEEGNQKIEINASHLQDGFYFLHVYDGTENRIKKFYKNSRS